MHNRSEEMVDALKRRGMDYAFAERPMGIVIVGPGSPVSEFPTRYTIADLQEAVNVGLLEKRRFSGSINLDVYGLKQT